jgi:CRP-like cAMP-binding protein
MVVGIAASLAAPIFAELLDNTPQAKARKRAMMPAQARQMIDSLSRRLLESQDRETELRRENAQMRRLLNAEASFGRNHRADIQATLGRSK